MGTLEHVSSPGRFVEGVLSVLKPGGIWLVTMLNPAVQTARDPYHYQEWLVEEFRSFLEPYFPTPEIRWHVMLPSGRQKLARTGQRYSVVPTTFKRIIKKLIGKRATWRLATIGGQFCDPEDFAWSITPDDTAIEFLAICRKH